MMTFLITTRDGHRVLISRVLTKARLRTQVKTLPVLISPWVMTWVPGVIDVKQIEERKGEGGEKRGKKKKGEVLRNSKLVMAAS